MRNFEKKTPRAICLEILNQLKEEDRHPDRLLSDSFKRYRHLTPLDRGFLTELTYGVLRWREKLDWSIRHLSKIPLEKIEPGTLNILRLGLYQIEFLTRTPASAAVNESVELAKRHRGSGGGGFVNAILRSFLRKKGEISYPEIDQDPALHLSVVHSHPLWLVRRWIEEVGIEDTLNVCVFNNRISPLTLRTNTLKMGREELIERIGEKGLKAIPASFAQEGILLEDPPPTSELPFLNDGFFTIQDEASQLVTSVLNPKSGEKILDGCASPGGKTTHIAQRMENRGEVYALDLTKDKLALIEEMCRRLGIKIVKTLKGDATQFLPVSEGMTFDRVLADVPCSGFGTLRKNPDLKWRKGEEDIKRLSDLQLSILAHLSEYVKKGGVLVYSTCTVFHEENEGVVEKFLEGHPEFQLDRMAEILPKKCHALIKDGYLKTFPPKDGMDGFFIARLIKKD
ncbi:MAG: 16S rRNA (cytosine(967)-C(5))-methyltransferase RsmB [Deltaproteobacteria bacterium]|nr:16S rRNA (cytosine(967)-C(5))-methyltransferase RsmB [Deltaproteobacteria bacterium]